MVGFSFDEIWTRRNRISTTRFLNFGVIFPPAGKFCAGTNRPKPAPAGRMLCRLSCTVSCIFPGRRCFSPQRVVLYFYLYPRAFLGGCAGNPRGVARMCGTKRPVLTLGEHRRHWGHKTRNHVSTLEVQTAEKPVTMRVCGQVQIVNWGLFYPVVLPNFHGLNFAGKWL